MAIAHDQKRWLIGGAFGAITLLLGFGVGLAAGHPKTGKVARGVTQSVLQTAPGLGERGEYGRKRHPHKAQHRHRGH